MDSFDHRPVEAALSVGITQGHVNTWDEAKSYLTEKNVVDADGLIKFHEEIQAIFSSLSYVKYDLGVDVLSVNDEPPAQTRQDTTVNPLQRRSSRGSTASFKRTMFNIFKEVCLRNPDVEIIGQMRRLLTLM